MMKQKKILFLMISLSLVFFFFLPFVSVRAATYYTVEHQYNTCIADTYVIPINSLENETHGTEDIWKVSHLDNNTIAFFKFNVTTKLDDYVRCEVQFTINSTSIIPIFCQALPYNTDYFQWDENLSWYDFNHGYMALPEEYYGIGSKQGYLPIRYEDNIWTNTLKIFVDISDYMYPYQTGFVIVPILDLNNTTMEGYAREINNTEYAPHLIWTIEHDTDDQINVINRGLSIFDTIMICLFSMFIGIVLSVIFVYRKEIIENVKKIKNYRNIN